MDAFPQMNDKSILIIALGGIFMRQVTNTRFMRKLRRLQLQALERWGGIACEGAEGRRCKIWLSITTPSDAKMVTDHFVDHYFCE